MAIRLLFEGSAEGPAGAHLAGTEAWHASARFRRAILRNLDAGVLAIMLWGCALVASHLVGEAVATVQASAGGEPYAVASAAQPHVAVAQKACVAHEDTRIPAGAAM